jgi:hypothetical protein
VDGDHGLGRGAGAVDHHDLAAEHDDEVVVHVSR